MRKLLNAWCILIIMAGSEVLKCDCEITEVIDYIKDDYEKVYTIFPE